MIDTLLHKMLLAVLLTVGCFNGLIRAEPKFSGDQVWRVYPQTQEELKYLQDFIKETSDKVDAWKQPVNVYKEADIHIPQNFIDVYKQKFHEKGLRFEVMIDDVRHLIEENFDLNDQQRKSRSVKSPKSFTDFNYEEYHPAEEIEEWMDMVVEEVDYVSKFQVGVTYEGRPMHALKISKPSANPKQVIYVDALIHAREWITSAATLWMFAEVFSNNSLSYLTDNVDWYFIPMINVDGYMHTWSSPDNRLWRKTRSKGVNLERSGTCQGVDANRNWPSQYWSGAGASANPCDITYYGPAPASEPEVRHLTYFINKNIDAITAVISVHSYSQLILWPYNYAEGAYPPNKEEHETIGQAMADAMYTVEQKTYTSGQGAETIYVCTGVTMDWTQEINIDINYTFELRDTGRYGFILPPDQIVPNGKEMLLAMNVLYEKVMARQT